MQLFPSFLVWSLGKLSLAQGFFPCTSVFPFQNHVNFVIKITNLKSKIYTFCINEHNTKLS